MDTEFNYLYEDKYYENAVKNLKSTFYDVVEREEIMLNNLENRIAQETDDGVKARLLDLWSKQNDSLDRSIVMFRQLKQSVRVIDSFVQELSEIDKAIVSDIINQTNNIRTTRVAQMEQQDIMEQPVEEQVQETTPEEVVVEEPVEEQVQEVAPEEVVVVEPVEEQVQEVAPEEVVVEEPVEEQVQEVAPEEVVVEEPVEEQVQETIPEEVVEEPVEEQVQETIPEEVVEEPVEEQVQEVAPEEVVVEESVEEQVQETAPEEKEVVETDNNNNNNEEIKDPVEEEISMDLPLIESPEVNPQESVENNDETAEENAEEESQPLIPLEEESINVENNETTENEEEANEPLIPIDESTDLENVSIETNDTNEESTEEEQILENVEEKEDEIHFDESFNTDEVPEMEIVNEENDGMDLPNVVEADKIDYSAIDEEENKEEITNDEVVEIPNKKSEENISEDIDKVDISYIGKEDSDNPKAIIVTEGQFEKLNNSLETQENKLYNRGYLSSEIVNNTNYTLGKNTNNNEHDDQLDSMLDNDSISISENPTREEMEELIEKAAELYKSGKKHEAQALYEEISRINDEMHQDKGPELVKAA